MTQHPKVVRQFLNSLVQAEDYLVHNPVETKAMVRKRLKFDEAFIARAWPQHRFSLTLDLSLITAMTDEARWMIKNNLTAEKQAPDFLDYIYVDGLKAVKPQAVNIMK